MPHTQDWLIHKKADDNGPPADAIHQLAEMLSKGLQLGGGPAAAGADYKMGYLQELLAQARGFNYINKGDTRPLPIFEDSQTDNRWRHMLRKHSAETGLRKTALAPLAALPWMTGPLMAYFGYQGTKDTLASGRAMFDDLADGHPLDALGDAGWTAFNAATTVPMLAMPLRAAGRTLKATAVGSKAGGAVMRGGKKALRGLDAESRAVLEAMAKDKGAIQWANGGGKSLGLMDLPQKLLNGMMGKSKGAAAAAWKYGDKLDRNLLLRAADFPNRLGLAIPYMAATMGVPAVMGEPGYEARAREKEEKRRELAEKMGIPYFQE